MLFVECMQFSPSLCEKLNIEVRKEYYYGKLTDVALLVGADFILNNVKIFIRDTDDNTVEGILYKELKEIIETTDLRVKGVSLGQALNRDAYNRPDCGRSDEAELADVFSNLFSINSVKVTEISVSKSANSYYDKVIDDLVDDYSIKSNNWVDKASGKYYRKSGTL